MRRTSAFVFTNIFFKASLAQESLLQNGIEQYRNENYEEALEILNDVFKKSSSTITSFYLALTCKQMGQTEKAKEFFIKAITEEPKILDAYIELAHLLYQTDQLDEAKKWIGEAEAQKIMRECRNNDKSIKHLTTINWGCKNIQ